jgi:hypothetical protein
MPFEHALVSLDGGRLSAAENPPLHNSREPIGSSPNWGQTRSCRTCSSELVALRVTTVAESPAKLLVLSRSELAVARLVATELTNRDASFPGDHSPDLPRMRRPYPRRPANTTTTSDNALWVPTIHPRWSGGISILVEGAAEPVPSAGTEARDPLRIGNRFG